MPADPIAESKRQHDAGRQGRAVLVRLSEDEAADADWLRGTKSRAALLRELLLKEAARKRKPSRQ